MIINVMIAIVIIINEPASTACSHTGCKLMVESRLLRLLALSQAASAETANGRSARSSSDTLLPSSSLTLQ